MRCLTLLLSGLILTLLSAHPAQAATRPVLYGGTVLFVDNHRVQSTSGVTKVYYRGQKMRVANRPVGQVDLDPVPGVDSRLLDMTTIIKEGDLWRMWLRSGLNVGYRESTDGLHWHIKDPDHVILVKGVTGASVVKDPVRQRYYLLGFDKARHRFVEMVSTNGLDFQYTNNFGGQITTLAGDFVTAWSNPGTRGLLAVAKWHAMFGARCSGGNYPGGRTFGVTSSPSTQARYWFQPAVKMLSDCTDANSVGQSPYTPYPVQLYGAVVKPYGDQDLVFPWLFTQTSATPGPDDVPAGANWTGWVDGTIDTQIASTPDAAHVRMTRADPTLVVHGRRARPSLIARGANGSWDDGMLFGSQLVTVGNTDRLYYNGWDATHSPAIPYRHVHVGVASFTRGRFVGLRAPRFGKVTTRPFYIPRTGGSRTLHVNASLPAGKALHVSVLDAKTGRMLPGWEGRLTAIKGNATDRTIRWKGKRIGRLHNKSIQLVFTYTGTLYSYSVR